MKLRARIATTIENAYYKIRSWYFVSKSIAYFYKDPIDDKSIIPTDEILDKTKVTCKRVDKNHWEVETAFQDKTRKARFWFLNRFNPARPTFIYCPPTVGSAKKFMVGIFLSRWVKRRFNIAFIMPPYYDGKQIYIAKNADSFHSGQLLIVNYILSIQECYKVAKELGSKKTIGLGLSMSGIALIWHAYKFNSLDSYLIAMAIPNLARIMFSSLFEYMIHEFHKRKENPMYEEAFEIKPEALLKSKNKIHLLLNKQDSYVNYYVALEFWRDIVEDITTFNVGHISIISLLPELKNWIKSRARELIH
ncbi:MAG: hypothetical protein Fur003_4910 [Candidatus Dojkabacteria bacterium]